MANPAKYLVRLDGTKVLNAEYVRDPSKFYAGNILPSAPRVVHEYNSEAEYLENVRAYEEAEANCNTCRHLVRVPHQKAVGGFLPGSCSCLRRPLSFHPEDPMHCKSWVSRRS